MQLHMWVCGCIVVRYISDIGGGDEREGVSEQRGQGHLILATESIAIDPTRQGCNK